MSKIDYYKNNISLIEYILYKELDWHISDGSSNNQIKIYNEFVNEYGDIEKGDLLIISRYKSGENYYDNYFNSVEDWKGQAGTIIDFVSKYVLEEKTINYAKVFSELDSYISSDKYVKPEESRISLRVHSKRNNGKTLPLKSQIKNSIKSPTKKAFNYLKSRRISSQTYLNELFVGTFAIYTYKNKDYIKDNPAFMYLNSENKIAQIQQIIETTKENTFKREKYFLKDIDRGESLYKSNKTPNINIIILTEAPEKCMAHFEIYNKDMKKNNIVPYYLATGGNVSSMQLEHLSKIVREHKMHLILSFDNDKPGKIYNLKTLLHLNSSLINLGKKTINNNEFYEIKINNPDFSKNKKFEEIYYRYEEKNINKVRALFSKIYNQGKDMENCQVQISTDKSITYLIKSTTENTQNIEKSLKDFLLDNNKIKVSTQYSITKDWVDDLERIDILKVKEYEKQNLPNKQ